MSPFIPSTQRAITQGLDGQPFLRKDAAVPPLLPGTALIRTAAVALNPSDHKILTNFPLPGAYVGSDFAGTIVQVSLDEGAAVLTPGTVVCGTAVTFSPQQRFGSGAFAEYVRVPTSVLFRVPPTLPVIEAATLGTALATCILALWAPDALSIPGTPDSPVHAEQRESVLVYGASTATGTVAVQLLRLSGYDPVATCSAKNFDLVRGRGAVAAFDYTDPGVADKIKMQTSGRLRYVLDCIADDQSVACCYAAIQRPGGRYVSLEKVADELLAKRRAVHQKFVIGAEVVGQEINLGGDYVRPASKESLDLAVRFVAILQKLLDKGELRAHPTQTLEGGLRGIISGLEMLKRGEVSGRKLVAFVGP